MRRSGIQRIKARGLLKNSAALKRYRKVERAHLHREVRVAEVWLQQLLGNLFGPLLRRATTPGRDLILFGAVKTGLFSHLLLTNSGMYPKTARLFLDMSVGFL